MPRSGRGVLLTGHNGLRECWLLLWLQRLGGFNPCSSSKGCTELVIAADRSSLPAESGVMLAGAKAGNVIGGDLVLAERLGSADGASFARGWTFGPGDEDCRPVRDVVERVARHCGGGA